ncbi:MAG: hypothetical protein ACJ8J7_02390, partial [Sulfurifustaceae bacterium]
MAHLLSDIGEFLKDSRHCIGASAIPTPQKDRCCEAVFETRRRNRPFRSCPPSMRSSRRVTRLDER